MPPKHFFDRSPHKQLNYNKGDPAAAWVKIESVPMEEVAQTELKNPRSKKKFFVIFLILIIALGSLGGWWFWLRGTSPVPKSLRQSVSFAIYYPEQKKLPAGYSLDTKSFSSPQRNVIIYRVNHGGDKLVFSVQPKPSDSEIQKFNSSYIPLRNAFSTPIGQAQIGAFGGSKSIQTLASLPTYSGPWIIVTAPSNISQDQLKQILLSLKT